MKRIDFNCDLGEGCGDDAAIVPWISSASIACGGHAGDQASMRMAIALCRQQGVAIGAHPSFEDRQHFGRRELAITADAIHAQVRRQIAALASACAQGDVQMSHVKPHGALYNIAARDPDVAEAIVDAVRSHDASLVLYALSGSALACAGETAGLHVAHEVFAERRYEADGTLTPRGTPGAVVEEIGDAITQVRMMLDHGQVTARTGESIAIRVDTICLHGDRKDAPGFARRLHETLVSSGIHILSPDGQSKTSPRA